MLSLSCKSISGNVIWLIYVCRFACTKIRQMLWLVVSCQNLGPIQKIQVPFGFSGSKLEYKPQSLPIKQPISVLVPVHFNF